MNPCEPGRVVKARAGRDAGRLFVVTAILDESYVYIANGTTRKVDSPKKKKIRHLLPQPVYFTNFAEKLAAGTRVFDSELRKALAGLENATTPARADAPEKEEG